MENKPIPFKGRSLAFTAALVFTFIIATFSINIDFTEFSQRNEINIPTWYFYLIFLVDLVMIAGLVLIYFYRKIGVYAFPLAVFVHFLAHNYYLSSFLYFDLFLLFLYFCLILVAVVPRWQFYK